MIYNAIKHILPEFRFEGQYRSVEELTSGNINNTYHLQYAKEGKIIHYTLQHINQFVFKEPDKVMDNILMVTMHLRDDLVREGINHLFHSLVNKIPCAGIDFHARRRRDASRRNGRLLARLPLYRQRRSL